MSKQSFRYKRWHSLLVWCCQVRILLMWTVLLASYVFVYSFFSKVTKDAQKSNGVTLTFLTTFLSRPWTFTFRRYNDSQNFIIITNLWLQVYVPREVGSQGWMSNITILSVVWPSLYLQILRGLIDQHIFLQFCYKIIVKNSILSSSSISN